MGYCMSQRESYFKMDPKDFPAAFKSVQALHGSETIGDSGGRHFFRVDYDLHEINDFAEMLRAWRWELELDGGEVVGISFQGEKLGDDHVLFNAIAPWVEKGSYIQMQGEDGMIWRWVFDGKKCVEKSAKISF